MREDGRCSIYFRKKHNSIYLVDSCHLQSRFLTHSVARNRQAQWRLMIWQGANLPSRQVCILVQLLSLFSGFIDVLTCGERRKHSQPFSKTLMTLIVERQAGPVTEGITEPCKQFCHSTSVPMLS